MFYWKPKSQCEFLTTSANWWECKTIPVSFVSLYMSKLQNISYTCTGALKPSMHYLISFNIYAVQWKGSTKPHQDVPAKQMHLKREQMPAASTDWSNVAKTASYGNVGCTWLCTGRHRVLQVHVRTQMPNIKQCFTSWNSGFKKGSVSERTLVCRQKC